MTIMAKSTSELCSARQLAKTLYGQLSLLEERLGALHLEQSALRWKHLRCLMNL